MMLDHVNIPYVCHFMLLPPAQEVHRVIDSAFS
jgi:hypothetical protein